MTRATQRGLKNTVSRVVDADEARLIERATPDPATKALLDALPRHPSRPRAVHIETSTPREHGKTPRMSDHANRIELIDVSLLAPSPFQERRLFGAIDDLATSIRRSGLRNPVLARRNRAGEAPPFTLIFGERRLRAFRRLQSDDDPTVRAHHQRIPAFVIEADEIGDRQLAIFTAEENAQREDLTPWELAQSVVQLKRVLDADSESPVSFEQLGQHFAMGAGAVNEYHRIGQAIPERVLRDAGVVSTDNNEELDWETIGALRKQRLLTIAKREPRAIPGLLRHYVAQLRGTTGRKKRRTGPRFDVETLRARGNFTMKIEKPLTPASYTSAQSESFLRDAEPMLTLLAEIAGGGAPVYAPASPNLPGAYLLIQKAPGDLSADERRDVLAAIDALRARMAAPRGQGPSR